MECHFLDFLDLLSDLSDLDLLFLSVGLSEILSADDFLLELLLTSFSTTSSTLSTLGALFLDLEDLLGVTEPTIASYPGKSYSIPNSFNLVRFSFSFSRRPPTLAALYSSVLSAFFWFLNLTWVGTNCHSLFPFLKVSLWGVSTKWHSIYLWNSMYPFIV